jgi:predicted TIM-barrel fold metal-dependent hydrolase
VHVFDAAAPVPAGSHYRPAHRPLAHIEAQAAQLGIHHLVLVQPSVYGSDNSLLLRALATQPGRHRGVVVLGAATPDAELDAMHAAGVRGVRLNCVSPVGEALGLAQRFARLAPRLLARQWHLQWYVRPEQLAEVAALHAGPGPHPTCVLDHLAGMHAGIGHDHPAWQALQALADQGAWVKLSGWYRLGAAEPYLALLPVMRRVAALFGERLVWGSDWPHTSFAPDRLPRYASTWEPVVAALGPTRLVDTQPAIYR